MDKLIKLKKTELNKKQFEFKDKLIELVSLYNQIQTDSNYLIDAIEKNK